MGKASACSRSSRPRRTMDICSRSPPIGNGLEGVLTSQQLAVTPPTRMGPRSGLNKTQGKLLRSSWASSARINRGPSASDRPASGAHDMPALRRKRTNSRLFRYVRFVPKVAVSRCSKKGTMRSMRNSNFRPEDGPANWRYTPDHLVELLVEDLHNPQLREQAIALRLRSA